MYIQLIYTTGDVIGKKRDETGPDALPKIHKYATTLYKIKTIIETYAVLNTYTHMYIKDLYMYIYI